MSPEAERQSTLLGAMLKQLPPSTASPRLLDLTGQAGPLLAAQRADISTTDATVAAADWPDDFFDAVVAYDLPVTDDLLQRVLGWLRPGGRLIIIQPDGQPDAGAVAQLERVGYGRILVEPAHESHGGALLRGEKAHQTDDTLARIQMVAGQDADQNDLTTFRGHYVHLLVRQTPNKPVWKRSPDEPLEWHAAALQRPDADPVLLSFSSLPNAVGFMQTAVMRGRLVGVNKVGKFSRAVAATWSQPVLLNPDAAILDTNDVIFVPVDVTTAEAPDE